MRLRSDFWVSAYLRRCQGEGAFAVQRRKGAAEAGAIHIVVDNNSGETRLYSPAPQSLNEDETGRRWQLMPGRFRPEVEIRLLREANFDPDLWIIEVEDREGRHFLDLVEE